MTTCYKNFPLKHPRSKPISTPAFLFISALLITACSILSGFSNAQSIAPISKPITASAPAPTSALSSSLSLEQNEIFEFTEFAYDHDLRWSAADIFSGHHQSSFKNFSQSQKRFDKTDGVVWVKIELPPYSPIDKNHLEPSNVIADHARREYLLEVNWTYLQDLRFYKIEKDQSISLTQTGSKFPFLSREREDRTYLFGLHQDKRPVIYLLRVRHSNPFNLRLQLWDPEKLRVTESKRLFILGIYYGSALLLLFYNLFVYLSTREIRFLYYIGALTSGSLTLLFLDGVGFQYLWSQHPSFNSGMRSIALIYAAFNLLFTYEFLDLRIHSPKLAKYYRASILVVILFAIFYQLSNVSLQTEIMIFFLSYNILGIATGIYCYLKKIRAAIFFLPAYGFLHIMTFIAVLAFIEVLPSNSFTLHAFRIGSLFEMLILSLGLADRINIEKKLKLQALKLNDDIQSQMTLDHMVDNKTGLPNRIQLEDKIRFHYKHETPFFLIFFKPDRFKDINNTIGYHNADRFLKIFSSKIEKALAGYHFFIPIGLNVNRDPSLIAQVDNTSFAAIYVQTNDQHNASEELARLKTEIDHSIIFDDLLLDIHTRIAVASSADASDVNRLLQQALVALTASDISNDFLCIYSEEIDPYSAEKLSLLSELRQAINCDELDINFQPQIDLKSNQACGIEALCRWTSRQGRQIPPAEFITIAETSDVIGKLTRWVIARSVLEYSRIYKDYPEINLSVNLSARNLLEQDLGDFIENLLTQFKIPPQNLTLEITESSMIDKQELSIKKISEIKNIGCKVSVDDFGTGYASLTYLKSLPIEEVKIDKSFITELIVNNEDRMIVNSSITMCHNLGLSVVAEGIEDKKTYQFLQENHCDIAQGYYIAKPMPIEELEKWLLENAREKLSPANSNGFI